MLKRNSANGQWAPGNQTNLTHGVTVGGHVPRLFKAWCAMRDRCNNPDNPCFKNYGARGIKVCARWENYLNFAKDVGVRPAGMSLGRIDNDGDYSPENCRWETGTQQANNKRNVQKYEYNGRSLTASGWAKETGLKSGTIKFRLKRGWPLAKALTVPLWTGVFRVGNKRGPYKTHKSLL